MEFTVVEGLRTVKFDLIFTLALAASALFVGYKLQGRVPVLARASIPAAAIGGLLFALVVYALRARGTLGVGVDATLRTPLQTIFFTTIGLGATLTLLRAGGWRMAFFWLIASLLAVVQNIVGIGVALSLGAPAALGVICGSLTLTGGPSTGVAFAPVFEGLGVAGASAFIIASATFGIFTASLVGNPVATALIRRLRLAVPTKREARDRREDDFWAVGNAVAETENTDARSSTTQKADPDHEALTGTVLLKNLLLVLALMGVGALLSFGITRLGVILPGYIGAMVVAAVVRNVDDRFGWFNISTHAVEVIGAISLALFLVIALMSLELWKLAGLAVPMLIILAVQVVLVIAYAVLVTFILMGRDYEAAVTSSGHIGFGLGITPNAVANMEALVARYAPAPRSFLIVPVVGAFFIDFSNSIIITFFANWLR